MIGVAVVMALFDALSLALFLAASLGGLLVLVEAATPRYGTPRWLIGLRRVVAVGLVLFGVYLAVRLSQLAPPGAF